MKIKIKRSEETKDLQMPSYAHEGDAGMDIVSAEAITIDSDERVSVPTGLYFEIPDGYVGLVWEKSGLAFKHGIKTCSGVLDSGYRGELKICLLNTSDTPYTFERGDRVAQLLIQKIERPDIEVVDELSDTSRGEGGFGSTGK